LFTNKFVYNYFVLNCYKHCLNLTGITAVFFKASYKILLNSVLSPYFFVLPPTVVILWFLYCVCILLICVNLIVCCYVLIRFSYLSACCSLAALYCVLVVSRTFLQSLSATASWSILLPVHLLFSTADDRGSSSTTDYRNECCKVCLHCVQCKLLDCWERNETHGRHGLGGRACIRCLVEDCAGIQFSTLAGYRNHLGSVHGVTSVCNRIEKRFSTREEIMSWKADEKKATAKFVTRRGVTKASGGVNSFYYCHCSGQTCHSVCRSETTEESRVSAMWSVLFSVHDGQREGRHFYGHLLPYSVRTREEALPSDISNIRETRDLQVSCCKEFHLLESFLTSGLP